VCYSYGSIVIVVTKCSYDCKDPINRFILSGIPQLLVTYPIHFTIIVIVIITIIIIIIIFKLTGWDFGYWGRLLAYCTSPG
jgi:Ca2+/Na+ antiporter